MANIFRGPEPHIPTPNISNGRFLIDKVKSHGDRVALICAITGQEVTYAELLDQSMKLAGGFRDLGLKEGDAVAIISENNLDYYVVVLATFFLGAAVAPVNPTYVERELEHCLTISQPRLVVGASHILIARVLPVVRKMITEGILGADTRTLVLGDGPCTTPGVQTTQEVASGGSSVEGLPVTVSEPADKVSFIMCSSGTTGLPKGVELTNKNSMACIYLMQDPRIVKMTNEDTISGILPFFHIYGLGVGFIAFAHGARLVVFPQFNPEGFLTAVQTYKMTMLFLVPPILVFLGKHPMVSKFDLSSVREIWCAAASLSREMQEAVTARLGKNIIRQGYGLTETTCAVMLSPINCENYGSAGKLMPGVMCKVLNMENGSVMNAGEKGEICISSELVMKGYRGNSDATKATIDDDGWLHTGDIGYIDEDGFVYIVDRLKDLIKYKGFQVAPAELEALLLTHSAVRDVAVIGVPDEKAGELPRAFIVRQQGAVVTEQEIADFVAEKISPSKHLHGGVEFVTEIPKSASGKIMRRNLRDVLMKKE